jgi:hypothetical protein
MIFIHIKPYGDLKLHIHYEIDKGEPQQYLTPGIPEHVIINKIEIVDTTLYQSIDITDFIMAETSFNNFIEDLEEEIYDKHESV